MEETAQEECRDCRTIFYLSFAALLSLFILAYLTRPSDGPLIAPILASSTPEATSTR